MNAKHQFKYTYNETDLEEFSPLEVTFEIPGEVSLTQMLYNFERYLQACGFVFDGKLDFVEDRYDLPEEELDYWNSFHLKEDETPNGLTTTSSPVEISEWNDQFDATKNTASSKDSISTEEYQKRRNWNEAEKKLKEWNEGIAKLENDLKAKKDIEQQAYERASRNAAVVKNNWVHGICNPPSPDWKKTKSDY